MPSPEIDKRILSQNVIGRTVGGRGPEISPLVMNPLINEGAHTYVAQELQPYLNIWQKNNPGKKVINFHVGEPSELPLDCMLKEGAKIHIEAYLASVASSIFGGRFKETFRPYYERAKKKFGYQSTQGIDEAREAWAEYYNRNNVYADPVNPGEVLLGASGKAYAIFVGNVLKRDGMDAAILAPMYPGNAAAVLEATSANKEPWKHGIHGIPVTAENHWQPDSDETAKILNENNIKFVVLCNPQNPTGGVLTEKTAKPFIDHAKENEDVVIFEDNVYGKYVWNEDYVTLARNKDIQGQVINMRSTSKALADTGARVSVIVIRDEMPQVRKAVLAKMNHEMSSGPTTETFKAIPALSEKGEREIVKRVDLSKKRKDAVVREFNLLGLDSNNPGGAFYIMIRVPEGITASEFSKKAAQYGGVTFLPAKNFGSWKNEDGSYKIKNPKGEPLYPEETAEKYIRVAFVGDTNDMVEGIRRLSPLMNQLQVARKVA